MALLASSHKNISMIGLSKGIKGLRSIRNGVLEPLMARKERMSRSVGAALHLQGQLASFVRWKTGSSSRLVQFLHLRLFPLGHECENPGEVTLLRFGLDTTSVGYWEEDHPQKRHPLEVSD